jgi:hypothetical protein
VLPHPGKAFPSCSGNETENKEDRVGVMDLLCCRDDDNPASSARPFAARDTDSFVAVKSERASRLLRSECYGIYGYSPLPDVGWTDGPLTVVLKRYGEQTRQPTGNDIPQKTVEDVKSSKKRSIAYVYQEVETGHGQGWYL